MNTSCLTLLFILLTLAPTARAASSASASPSDLSEWQHQAPGDALEFTPFYTAESEKASFHPSSSLSAGQKSGGLYGLKAEYGWLSALSLGAKLISENDAVKSTDATGEHRLQTNGLVGFSVFTRGNTDVSVGTLTYGLEILSVDTAETLTAGGINASQSGYEISPYLGLEFKLDGAVTGVRFQYGIMGDQALTNELATPTTTQHVKGGNQVKGTIYYEKNWSWFKLGVAATYLSSSATSDKSTGLSDNDQSTTLEGTFYIPLYLSDSFTLLPSVDYADQSYASSLASLKSRADLDFSLALRIGI